MKKADYLTIRNLKFYGKNKTFSRLPHLCQKPVGRYRYIYIATLRYKINDPMKNRSDFNTACSLPNTTMDFISQDSNSVQEGFVCVCVCACTYVCDVSLYFSEFTLVLHTYQALIHLTIQKIDFLFFTFLKILQCGHNLQI